MATGARAGRRRARDGSRDGDRPERAHRRAHDVDRDHRALGAAGERNRNARWIREARHAVREFGGVVRTRGLDAAVARGDVLGARGDVRADGVVRRRVFIRHWIWFDDVSSFKTGSKRKRSAGRERGDCVDALRHGCFALERRSNALGEGRLRGRRRDTRRTIPRPERVSLPSSATNAVFSGVTARVLVYAHESVRTSIAVELSERDGSKPVRVRRHRRHVLLRRGIARERLVVDVVGAQIP